MSSGRVGLAGKGWAFVKHQTTSNMRHTFLRQGSKCPSIHPRPLPPQLRGASASLVQSFGGDRMTSEKGGGQRKGVEVEVGRVAELAHFGARQGMYQSARMAMRYSQKVTTRQWTGGERAFEHYTSKISPKPGSTPPARLRSTRSSLQPSHSFSFVFTSRTCSTIILASSSR